MSKQLEQLRLLGYYQVKGEIECISGLRVGGGKDTIEIGGIDNPVIKTIAGKPYIPGSSIKGKLRSLLEMYLADKIKSEKKDGSVHTCKEFNCPICRIFGVGGGDGSSFGPGRLIVRDATIVDETYKQTEIKYENVINRISGTAEHPRQMERVPAGVRFNFKMDYRIFSLQQEKENDADNGAKDKELFDNLLTGMKLLELDTLGGSGSRGYGKVKFVNVKITDEKGKDISSKFDSVNLGTN